MPLGGERPTVLLPIETINREFTSNLVLATVLASKGSRVVVGHKEVCHYIGVHSDGVAYVGKDMFDIELPPTAAHLADELEERSSAAIFYQEEGGIFPKGEWCSLFLEKHRTEYIRRRSSMRMCVWGTRQKELLAREGVASEDRVSITGCPRLDLCAPRFAWLNEMPREAQDRIRDPYILVCTRFTSVAHFRGMGNFFSAWNDVGPGERFDARLATWSRDAHDLADFVRLTHGIAAAFPRYSIVLRPHPSEDERFYEQAFGALPGVTVTREASALDWIRGAELLVHSNCTTGVEALLAGKPVLNFLPGTEDRSAGDKEVACEAGVPATTVEEALERIGALLRGEVAEQMWSDRAISLLQNLEREAMPLLANDVLSVAPEASRMTLPARNALERLTDRFKRRRAPGMPSSPYVLAKRGAFSEEKVEQVVDGCAAHGVGGGRIEEFMPNCVVIEPE